MMDEGVLVLRRLFSICFILFAFTGCIVDENNNYGDYDEYYEHYEHTPDFSHYFIVLELDTSAAQNIHAATTHIADRLVAMGLTEAEARRPGRLTPNNQIRIIVPKGDIPDIEYIIDHITSPRLLIFRDETGNVLLTGTEVSHATATIVPDFAGVSHAQVNLYFTSEGTELFADATRTNIGRPIFIYMDDELLSSPIVNVPITDGIAVISGNFTHESAHRLASDINFGALPFNLAVVLVESR